jgi:acyl dehydratase
VSQNYREEESTVLKGLYYEDFEENKIYSTSTRTITETDLVSFTTLCGFFEPLFVDRGYVEKETAFDKRIAPGAMTFSMAEGLTLLSGVLYKTGIAFLGTDMEIHRPVFVGDTLHVEMELLNKREVKKQDRGVVTFLHRVKNQEGKTVMEYRIKRMVRKRKYVPAEAE